MKKPHKELKLKQHETHRKVAFSAPIFITWFHFSSLYEKSVSKAMCRTKVQLRLSPKTVDQRTTNWFVSGYGVKERLAISTCYALR